MPRVEDSPVNFARVVLFMALATMMVAWPMLPTMAADAGGWTLEAATQRVLELAPERRAAEANVAASEADLRHAGSWPNPSIDLRADDKLGQEDGRGGSDLTRIGISQPLPIRRLARQRTAAEAALRGTEANRRSQQLQLELETARAFYALQLAAARFRLAQERLALTADYLDRTGGRAKRDPLVRYLSPLENRRLAVLREEAQQAVLAAQREQEKTLIGFRSLLGLPPDTVVTLAPIAPPAAPPALAELERDLDVHPGIVAARQEVEAARAGIAVEESRRFADPELGVFRERDYLNGERRDVTVIELSAQIPLWNLNRGPVDKARAETMRAQANLAVLQRDAAGRLRQSYIELTRLIEQAGRMRAHLLDPAREVFDLTRRAFAAGEANILGLVDANNTYYDAQARYIEVLKDGALAAASLRLAAGQSIVTGEVLP
jgi:cobalt-zinc-cadmium efflux system outer membrane protein